MGYNPRGGHGYGDSRHGSSKSRFLWRKPKKQKEVIYVKDDPEPKIAPEKRLLYNSCSKHLKPNSHIFFFQFSKH
jgi:hypothetical protein